MSESGWGDVVETRPVVSIPVLTPEALAREQSPRPPKRYVPTETELSMMRRLSPGRSRWPAVDAFDDRANELGGRAAALVEELLALEERLRKAHEADREALTAWQLDDGKRRRPEPTAPAIEQEIEEKRADRDAALEAQGKVFEDKQQFVERHRTKLVREADRATTEAHKRYLGAIQALEQARAELVDSRLGAIWAALFPGPLASSQPPVHALACGLRKPVERTMGLTAQVSAPGLIEALRSDADVLREAMTKEQALELGAADPQQNAATWAATPEGQEQLRNERKQALEKYREMWGNYPA